MRVRIAAHSVGKNISKIKKSKLLSKKIRHANLSGRVQAKDLGTSSYMSLKLYKRVGLPSKKVRIIDLFETKQAQKEVFRVDENFGFRTRAERFQQLN